MEIINIWDILSRFLRTILTNKLHFRQFYNTFSVFTAVMEILQLKAQAMQQAQAQEAK